jgi:hypothetical protein
MEIAVAAPGLSVLPTRFLAKERMHFNSHVDGCVPDSTAHHGKTTLRASLTGFNRGGKGLGYINFALVLLSVLPAAVLAQNAQPNLLGAGGNASGFDMGPETTAQVVQAATDQTTDKIPPGPFEPTWDSLAAHYKVPDWFV